MRAIARVFFAVPLALALLACGDDASISDAGDDGGGARDGASVGDAGDGDGGVGSDGGGEGDGGGENDAGGLDGGSDLVGVISGSCGELDDAELLSASPFLFENAIDFPAAFTMADEMRLSAGAQEILLEGTAGGSSSYSEAFAFEVLHRCEGAALIKTETEIVYDTAGTITDILVEIDGHKIGVSVTRAVAFPFDDIYPVETALTLLERKLGDILDSTANVSAEDAWVKQILHVIAYGPMHAESMASAWAMVDPALRADTILVLTVTHGMDDFIY
jgi:hypothetical protein